MNYLEVSKSTSLDYNCGRLENNSTQTSSHVWNLYTAISEEVQLSGLMVIAVASQPEGPDSDLNWVHSVWNVLVLLQSKNTDFRLIEVVVTLWCFDQNTTVILFQAFSFSSIHNCF